MKMEKIHVEFPITNEEYVVLDKKFGNLCEYVAWQLIRKNSRNNIAEDQEDISQEIKISIIRAGSYYKRQTYIEDCLRLVNQYAKTKAQKNKIKELQYLWDNKIRHGANKQKFGPMQEATLEKMVINLIPEKLRPDKNRSLITDRKFEIYCKTIAWNAQKNLGKKITKEKSIRTGLVSLSEFDYLGKF